MDYYVASRKSRKRLPSFKFKDAARMMEAFEHWVLVPTLFYEERIQTTVESALPGNGNIRVRLPTVMACKMALSRNRLSEYRMGKMKFDFIIIHEAGHEWFAKNINQIRCPPICGFHEGFHCFSEIFFSIISMAPKAKAMLM